MNKVSRECLSEAEWAVIRTPGIEGSMASPARTGDRPDACCVAIYSSHSQTARQPTTRVCYMYVCLYMYVCGI